MSGNAELLNLESRGSAWRLSESDSVSAVDGYIKSKRDFGRGHA